MMIFRHASWGDFLTRPQNGCGASNPDLASIYTKHYTPILASAVPDGFLPLYCKSIRIKAKPCMLCLELVLRACEYANYCAERTGISVPSFLRAISCVKSLPLPRLPSRKPPPQQA